MLRNTFDWKPRHLFGRGGHRPAAIVASGAALEGWNALPEEFNFSAIAGHSLGSAVRQGGYQLVGFRLEIQRMRQAKQICAVANRAGRG